MKLITNNKKASFNYFLEKKLEAGIELKGSEVKAIRLGKININDAYVTKRGNNELYLVHSLIGYPNDSNTNNKYFTHKEKRERRLLLHKKEILNLISKMNEDKLTIIPVKVYFKDQLIKVEIALARGKKLYDKRQTIKERDINRKIKNHY